MFAQVWPRYANSLFYTLLGFAKKIRSIFERLDDQAY